MRSTAKGSELQMNYDRLVVQLNNVTTGCSISRSWDPEWDDEKTFLQALFNMSKDEVGFFGGQMSVVLERKGAVARE